MGRATEVEGCNSIERRRVSALGQLLLGSLLRTSVIEWASQRQQSSTRCPVSLPSHPRPVRATRPSES